MANSSGKGHVVSMWCLVMCMAVTISMASASTQLPVRWNTTDLWQASTDVDYPIYMIRNAGYDVAVLCLPSSNPYNITQASNLYAVNTTNGKMLAKRLIGTSPSVSDVMRPIIATNGAGGLVAHNDQDGHFCVSSGITLNTIWCTPFTSACFFQPLNGDPPRGCSMQLSDTSLIVANNGTVLSFHAITGQEQWKATIPYLKKYEQYLNHADAPMVVGNNQAVVSFMGVCAFNLQTGALEYTFGLDDANFDLADANAMSANGDVVLIEDVSVVLVSPKGKVVRNHTFSPTPTSYQSPVLAIVHPHTGDIIIQSIGSYSNKPDAEPTSIIVIGSDNEIRWQYTSQGYMSNFHLHVATNTLFYLDDTSRGLIGRSMATGEIVSTTVDFNQCDDAGQPMVSVDGKTAMVSNCPMNFSGGSGGTEYEGLIGFSL